MSESGSSTPSSHQSHDSFDDLLSENEDVLIVPGQYEPYQNEPLARPDRQNAARQEDVDEDGLAPQTLAERYERRVGLDSWCKCGKCSLDSMVCSLEYRCCQEVAQLGGKLVFDGSIERISCVTEHEDYQAVTNKEVLLLAGPLLRRRNGRKYRKGGNPENQ